MFKKEVYLKNYCYNTAIDGFEAYEEFQEGEQFIAYLTMDLIDSNYQIYQIIDIIGLIANNSYDYIREGIIEGMWSMIEDIKLKADDINREDFESRFKYEIEEGVYKNIEEF